jgi:nucleotide-binding universal stress UspA family protein
VFEVRMKILLAVDGSSVSEAAVQSVASRPWPGGSEVRVLHVLRPPYFALDAYAPPGAFAVGPSAPASALLELEKAMSEAGTQLLERVAAQLANAGVEISTRMRTGDPREEIIQEADACVADLIVLGTHGHTGLKRLLLGSVALSVAQHAPCSVELARPPRP